jgi:putative glycosyltransferase (TIGR04372 family)
MAQKLNIIHQSRRTIIDINQANICRPIMDPILENFEHYKSINSDSIFNHPNLFFLTEKITMLATKKGFLSLPEMIELTLKSAGEINEGEILYTLSTENQNLARNLLVKLGLPKEAWFVGLHVRDSWRMNERNADIESYFSSINHITRSGGWVIRIGDRSMRSIKHLTNVIEIFNNSENFLILQDYVLSNSKFFISTSSGPSVFPPLFGVPMLSTNMVAVSKNNFSYLAPSLAIPKVWVERVSNRDVSLEDSFELDLGFVENSESKTGAFFTRNNTSKEIMAATIEMFNVLEGTPPEPSVRQNSLRILRRESGAVTFGDFAESFLN